MDKDKIIKQLKAENENLKKQNKISEESYHYQLEKRAEIGQVWFEEANKYKQCLDEIFENIEYIEATAERIDDDNCIVLSCRIAETSRNILQLIKQAKEVQKTKLGNKMLEILEESNND